MGTPQQLPQIDAEGNAQRRHVGRCDTSLPASSAQAAQMSGTFAGVRPGEVIWMVVRRAGSAQLYPASVPCIIAGDRWTCPKVEFGEATTGIFDAFPVIADGVGQAAFVDYLRAAAASGHASGLARLSAERRWGPGLEGADDEAGPDGGGAVGEEGLGQRFAADLGGAVEIQSPLSSTTRCRPTG